MPQTILVIFLSIYASTAVRAQTLPGWWQAQPAASTSAHWLTPWPGCRHSPSHPAGWPGQIYVQHLENCC